MSRRDGFLSSRSKESKIKGLVDLVSGEGLFLIDGTFALYDGENRACSGLFS